MAERFGKIRYAKLSHEDCEFALRNEFFQIALPEKEADDGDSLGKALEKLMKIADEFVLVRTPLMTSAEARHHVYIF